MGLFMYFIQCIGIMIPSVGMMTLIRREQNRTSVFLLMTDVGCLLINCSYLLLLKSTIPEAALVALKLEYVGNVMFYHFFAQFLLHYLKIRGAFLIMIPWFILDMANLFCVWNDGLIRLVYRHLDFIWIKEIEGLRVAGQLGLFQMIRYCLISFTLMLLLFFILYRMFHMKKGTERNNMGRLAGAVFVIIVSLNFTLLVGSDYDIVPICASCSIVAIIHGVHRGELLSVVETGREWVVEHMKNAFVVVDSVYGYLDANACAKYMFPELSFLMRNQTVGPELKEILQTEETYLKLYGRHYERVLQPIQQEGETIGYGLLLMDVTQQQRLMNQLKEAMRTAEEACQARSDFMSNVSHEIRTPMNAIVGMTDILLRSALPEQEKEYLWNIKNSGNALLTIINDILDFSKIESGKMEIIQEEYQPMSMFHDLSMIFLNRIGDKDIELLYDIDLNLPQTLCGDSMRLRQVIINLMNNAIKFTDRGHVKLSVTCERIVEDTVELKFVVEDSGQGIREEDLPKLFGMFQQVDTKRNRQKEGTGLGLAISKQLVELMNGAIQVESEYGKGSRFFFTIPQTICCTSAAVVLKETAVRTISGQFQSSAMEQCLRRLSDGYGMKYLSSEWAVYGKEKVDFFFTDDRKLLTPELEAILAGQGCNCYLLQNPMTREELETDWNVVNKPLYSLNFCQILNGDHTGTTGGEVEHLNFQAPEAKVLIVDDNEMNLKVAVGLLEPLGMQIELADNGKKALSMVEKKQYDIIFMDHMMPIMDGVEATKLLRSMEGTYYQTVPVIALTANVIAEARAEFQQAGMNDFAGKPIKLKEICAVLKKWLPQELIQNVETDALPETEEVTQFPAIEGLDVAEGIRNCGNETLFYDLLGDFYHLIDMKAEKIEKCLADGLLRDYTIEVHALKNTARMIGALELSDEFFQMEQLGNAQNKEELEQRTPGVLSHYRSYKPILKPYGVAQNQDKQAVSPQNQIQTLRALSDAMDQFDLDGADEAMKQLAQYQWSEDLQEKLERLRALVADVAMEEVMATAEEMIQIISEYQEDEG